MQPLYPKQSFQHTLREISVNREDPCELVRELISNAYDAHATRIWLAPFLEKHGLVFFDNGEGLSQNTEDERNGVLPYVAFFSIGKGTKKKGEGIGYKCQGSKLCFASGVVTVVTRCRRESGWRLKQIRSPKLELSESFNIAPEATRVPWNALQERVFAGGDARTARLATMLDQRFFEEQFSSGTLIIVEEFEVEDFEKYFGNADRHRYLYNYIRFYTAHGDVRRIQTEQGFDATEVNAFSSCAAAEPPRVLLGIGTDNIEVPFGWPYLEVNREVPVNPPSKVDRLRDSRFWARYAGNFVHEGVRYSMVLALDGHRRAMDGYGSLGRQRDARSGITLGSQRGTFLCVQGVRVCAFNELWSGSELESFTELGENQEHYVFMLDGDFELVTNRNSPSPESKAKLRSQSFLRKIREFLESDVPQRENGAYLAELVQRLRRERTHPRETVYIEAHRKLVKELSDRTSFVVTDVPQLAGVFVLEPELGEENMVGALYTMFSHLVPASHPLRRHWVRPLTFRARGIDAVGVLDQGIGDAITIEYKHTFRTNDEFNHPLSLTKVIVCWDYEGIGINAKVEDSYGYQATVKDWISVDESDIGFTLGGIFNRDRRLTLGHVIKVVSLKRLLLATFSITWQQVASRQVPKSPTRGTGGKARRRA